MPGGGTKNTSIPLLILANILVIILAVWQGWSFGNMLWVYWCQSVIIGIFHFFRLLFFKGPILPIMTNQAGFSINDRLSDKKTLAETGSNIFTAFFFALHYGLFHHGYATFLPMFSGETLPSVLVIIWPAVLIFAINHFLSLLLSYSNENNKNKSLSELFGEPYTRIVPMHLVIMGSLLFVSLNISSTMMSFGQTIIEAGQFPQVLGIIIFSILKIYADIAGHNKKHHIRMASGFFKEVNDKLESGKIMAVNAKDIKGEDLAKMLNDWEKKNR